MTPQASKPADAAQTLPRLELGGPWAFLKLFRSRHGLRPVPGLDEPEIALRSGRPFELPLIYSSDGRSGPVTLSVEMPAGWRLVRPNVPLTLPAEPQVLLTIGLEPPALTREQLRSAQAEDLVVTARSAAGTTTEVRLRVLLAPSALPF